MNQSKPLQIIIPKSPGRVIAAVGLTSFVLFTVDIAVKNLQDHAAMIPSIIWLMLVTAGIVHQMREEKGFVKFLEVFAFKPFAEVVETGPNTWDLRFGFRMAGHCLFYQGIPLNKIESLVWSSGQATSLAGRDMNDWTVVLWYDHDDPVKSEHKKKWKHYHPDQDPYSVNFSGPKEDAAILGREFLALLKNAGAVLVPGKDDCTFVRESARTG
jgi:hypothetical protein